MKEIRILKEKDKLDLEKDDKIDSGLIAAMKIQKIWRGFTDRRKTRRKKLEEMMLIGMIPQQNQQKRFEIMEKMNEVSPYY